MSSIDREKLRKLVNVLLRVSRINRFGSEKRDFLLEGLPLDAVHALKRDNHPRIDLQTMVAEVWTWGELKNKQLAIAVLIRNALAVCRSNRITGYNYTVYSSTLQLRTICGRLFAHKVFSPTNC